MSMFAEIIESIAPLLVTKWGYRISLAMLATAGLLVLAALINAPLTWHSDYTLGHGVKTSAAYVSPLNQTLILFFQIPNWHLFGEPEITALPITSLQLHLVGIIQAIPANRSRVIISEGGKPGKVYRIGDSVAPDVHITAITADGIILENSNHKEKLPLGRPPLSFQGLPKNLLPGE